MFQSWSQYNQLWDIWKAKNVHSHLKVYSGAFCLICCDYSNIIIFLWKYLTISEGCDFSYATLSQSMSRYIWLRDIWKAKKRSFTLDYTLTHTRYLTMSKDNKLHKRHRRDIYMSVTRAHKKFCFALFGLIIVTFLMYLRCVYTHVRRCIFPVATTTVW